MEDWLFELIDQGGYIGIFALMLAETIFPPIPSEVVMPLAGVSAARGTLRFELVAISGTAGAMAGNLIWYWVARSIGTKRLRILIERFGRWLAIDWRDILQIHLLFRRHGGKIVMAGRALPTIRTVISLPAGIARMELKRFLVWSTIGTAIWSTGLAAAGWVLGNRFGEIEKFVGPVATFVICLIAAAYVLRQLSWMLNKKPNQTPRTRR